MLYRTEGTIYAMSEVCTHEGGPLAEGTFEGTCVTCPWHSSIFDMKDGHVVHGPSLYPEINYGARVNNGKIEVRLQPYA
jgi:nitrite reductase/ring-hydroxylating ferredoxin subunit